MPTTPLPAYFEPDERLIAFLQANDFVEITEKERPIPGCRDFRHKHTRLYVAVESNPSQIVLENVHGWLWHYYKRLDTVALLYLMLRDPANEANKATYFLLNDSSLWTLPA